MKYYDKVAKKRGVVRWGLGYFGNRLIARVVSLWYVKLFETVASNVGVYEETLFHYEVVPLLSIWHLVPYFQSENI